MKDLQEKLSALIDIGISLTMEADIRKLFNMILAYSREITDSDAGSLYIKRGDKLVFEISHCDTINRRKGLKNETIIIGKEMDINKKSIAGYVALTGEILNFDDVYKIKGERGFYHSDSYDRKNEYRTKSMLVVPMKDKSGEIIGVLQLINSQDDNGNIVSFSTDDERLVEALGSQAAVTLKNKQLTDELKSSYLDTIHRLAKAAEFKDKETGGHIQRISSYSMIIAHKMGLPTDECELILFASPMHDIGKIGIPDSILQKPGRLTPEERKVMETHTTIGSKILEDSDVPILKAARVIALNHHERWDGNGYPQKLSQENIPLHGRIVALSDVFDALASKRCYKDAWPLEKVIDIIKSERGHQFDPTVTDIFVENIDMFKKILEKYSD